MFLPKGLKVGDIVQHNGKTVQITKVYSTGYNTKEVEKVQEPKEEIQEPKETKKRRTKKK